MKALTRIHHNDQTFEPGDSIKGISGDELEALKTAGAVEDESHDNLSPEDAEVEKTKLLRRLAELEASQGSFSPTPGQAAEQLMTASAPKAKAEDAKPKAEDNKNSK